jgi:competence protein ComEA
MSPEPVAPTAPAPAAPPGPAPAPVPARVAGPLDLNTATVPELDGLPGIGPVLAGRIVSHRDTHGPYRSTDDLLAVPGIGPRLHARLAPLVTVRAPRTDRPSLQIARPAAE